ELTMIWRSPPRQPCRTAPDHRQLTRGRGRRTRTRTGGGAVRRVAGAAPEPRRTGRLLARRGRVLALLLGLDRRAERRPPPPFEPAGNRRHLWPSGAADRAPRSDVLG